MGDMEVVMEEEEEHVDEYADTQAAAQETAMTGQEIVTDSFGELYLPPEQCEQMQQAWALLINITGSRDILADMIYGAWFGTSASLESLFTTPRTVAAFQFFAGINNFISCCADPARLKGFVETLAFGHMYLDITVPRVNLIRDSFVDLLVVELGSKLTSSAATGCVSLMNYIGGAQIFAKATYFERMQILEASWKLANDSSKNEERMASMSMENKKNTQEGEEGS